MQNGDQADSIETSLNEYSLTEEKKTANRIYSSQVSCAVNYSTFNTETDASSTNSIISDGKECEKKYFIPELTGKNSSKLVQGTTGNKTDPKATLIVKGSINDACSTSKDEKNANTFRSYRFGTQIARRVDSNLETKRYSGTTDQYTKQDISDHNDTLSSPKSSYEVRDLAYKIWCNRIETVDRQVHEEQLKKKAEIELKRKKELERLEMNRQVYLSWIQKKQEKIISDRNARQESEKQRLESEEKEINRRNEAEKVFIAWKQNKRGQLRQGSKVKSNTLREAEREKEKERMKAARESYESWQKCKTEEMREKERILRMTKKREEEKKIIEIDRKRQMAKASYAAWEIKKMSSMEDLRPSSACLTVQNQPWRPSSGKLSDFMR